MKICYKCKLKKPLKSFALNKQTSDGIAFYCKECNAKEAKEYRRSRDGLIRHIYSCQKMHSKKRGHVPPLYTKSEFIDWMNAQEQYTFLHHVWVKGKFNRWLRPSIDRLNDNLPYSFSNIRLTDWKTNSDKGHFYRRIGIHKIKYRKVAIIRIDSLGNLTEYLSIKDAMINNGDIRYSLKTGFKKNGYTFIKK